VIRKISVKLDEPQADVNASKSPRWFAKKKSSEPTQKLIFSFSKDADPDFDNILDINGHIPDNNPTSAETPKKETQITDVQNDLITGRTVSENSMASIPDMVITEIGTPTTVSEKAASSVVESSTKLLQIRSNADKQDSTSMRSFRSVTNTIISSGKEIEEETMAKKQRFWDFLTMVLSLSYAITVVMMGVTVYSFDILIKETEEVQTTVTSSFNMFLCVVGIAWLCYLIFDINRYIQAIEGHSRGSVDLGEIKLVEGDDGDLHIEMSLPGEKKTLPEYYGFTSGRHSGSFYLKIGAGVFCIGHVIHMGLNFVKEILYSVSDDDDINKLCSNSVNAVANILTPMYSIIQCFVIFKYGNVIVNKNKWLARFAFMHCISASICLWANTIINETLDTLMVKNYYKYDCSKNDSSSNSDDDYFRWITKSIKDDDSSSLIYLECINKNLTIAEHFDCVLKIKYFCAASNKLSSELFDVASLLYPFSIEFSFLVVGIWYILWSNIAKIDAYKDSIHFLPSVTPRASVDEGQRMEGHKQAMILFADCSSSNKGLFTGIIVLIITIIGGIVVLIMEDPCASYTSSTASTAVIISNVMESCILLICIFASIV
jgi:hypothetical protein